MPTTQQQNRLGDCFANRDGVEYESDLQPVGNFWFSILLESDRGGPILVSGFQKPADRGLAFRVFNLRKMKCRPSGQSTRAENLDSDPRKDALIHLFFGAEWR